MAWLKRLITTQRLQKLKIKYQIFDLIKNTDFDTKLKLINNDVISNRTRQIEAGNFLSINKRKQFFTKMNYSNSVVLQLHFVLICTTTTMYYYSKVKII